MIGMVDILDDAVLRGLIEEAQADINTVGLILSGSRGAGCARPDSDYDVYWAAWYDAYLNSFYRSLKAWRRDDIVGGRLHAAESALYLIRMLFSLERRRPPYLDRLEAQWTILSGQGWQEGELPDVLLGLVDNGEPKLQIALETRVEALMEGRGFGQVLDGRHGDIAWVKTWFI